VGSAGHIGTAADHEKLRTYSPTTIGAVVIGGCGRSGTTFDSRVLDRHPFYILWPESRFLLERITRARDLQRRFGALYRARKKILECRVSAETQVEFMSAS